MQFFLGSFYQIILSVRVLVRWCAFLCQMKTVRPILVALLRSLWPPLRVRSRSLSRGATFIRSGVLFVLVAVRLGLS